jgi:Tfp pilus assembly protein PilN
MRAVNLIPADARRGGGGGPSLSTRLPTYLFLGVLVAAVALVAVYVLTNNTISKRQAQVTTLQAEVAQTQARSDSLSHFSQFSQLTQSRVSSVRQLAASRFDWHATLSQLADVIPANTSLGTLNGTASQPAAATTSAPTSTTSAAGTSIELTGCTKSQTDVARLMSRLRLVDGVAGVSLTSSTKQGAGGSGAAASSGSAGTGAGPLSCGANGPSFDLHIQFSAPSTGATSATATATATATSTSPGATSSAPATTTAPATTAAPATTTAPSASGGAS